MMNDLPVSNDGPAALGVANVLPAENGGEAGGWLKLADYGDWPHPAGLQRLTPEAGARLAHGFKSLLGRLRRRFTGVPIYIGHPDDPAFAGQPGHDDTKAYGWVTDLEARPEGLYVQPRWSEPGRDLLRHAFYKFLSPRWQMKAVDEGTYEPVRLLSIGLTNHPNIPGEAVANQQAGAATTPATATGTATANGEAEPLLTGLLRALDLDAGAVPEALLANAEQLAQAARETRDAQLEAARFYRLATDADTARKTAEERAEAEHTGRIELALDNAELRGAVTPAERTRWREALEQDFDLALVEMANATRAGTGSARKPSGAPLTARLAERRPGGSAPTEAERFLTLVNERIARTGEDYTTAWARVRRASGGWPGNG
jgi:hypothetical protein